MGPISFPVIQLLDELEYVKQDTPAGDLNEKTLARYNHVSISNLYSFYCRKTFYYRYI